jgi:hypothetical membrane protein
MLSHARFSRYDGRWTTRTSALVRDAERVAGVLLFVLAAQFLTVIMLAASIAPAYDYAGGAISDLGATAQTAVLFNASLLAVGLLNIAAGYIFFRIHARRWLFSLSVLAGIGAIGAAAFPLGSSELHSIFAAFAFVFFNVLAIGTAAVVSGPMRFISFLAGAVGLVFFVLMVIGDGGNAAAFGVIGHGGTERMIVYPVMLWMLGFGGWLMAGPTAGSTDHRLDG